MNISGYETDPLRGEIERLRYSNLPGHNEVLNTHDSTDYDRDTEMQNVPQQGDVQVVAHGELASMQVCLPNDLSPSISNQNPTTEQQSNSPKYGRPLTPGGPRLITVITDEEIDGLRKLKTKEDRRKRTENPDPEHKKEVRKAGSKAHRERNLEEKTGLNSMKQQLEELIKTKESSRVKGINLYNEMQEKVCTSPAPNLSPDPLPSTGTNPAAVNQISSAGINGNNSRGIVTTAVAPTGQTGSSNATDERLPEGWELCFDQYGRKYYVDHTTKSTTWERPSNQPLPAGWEMKRDNYGRVYYVDHNTCSARWWCPAANILEAHEQWQSGRDQAMQRWGQRFLLQQGNGAAGGVAVKNDDPLGLLPEGWEKRVDTGSGRVYFFNHFNQITRWEDPRTQEVFGQLLPLRWEKRFTVQGVPFFFDHVNKTATYNDPRTGRPVGPIEMTGMERLFERTFRWKIAQFRRRCLSNSTPNFVKITVSRTNVFEDSFQEIMNKNPLDLRRRLYIEFRNEEQDASQIVYEICNPEEERLDYDGVAREWFFLLSHEMLNPMRYLFMCAGNNNNSLQINPALSVNSNHLKCFEFIGRFIAMALFHGKFIHSGFTMPFFKKMLNKRITLKDIEQVDFELYNWMTWIKNNNIDECKDLYFLADYELLGKWKTYELKPGGAGIRVTEATKNEYIDLLVQWRFNRGVEQQTQAFFDGFNSVLPVEWLQNFDERELEMLLCGMQEIDVDDWQRNTVYRNYEPGSEQVIFYFQNVRFYVGKIKEFSSFFLKMFIIWKSGT
ncbi:hypothetical protein WR25_23377 isoform B [Diploscapter pachys]|nr:hypothetical protein WR25_23377 isoform B [Diploscapter pachys]